MRREFPSRCSGSEALTVLVVGVTPVRTEPATLLHERGLIQQTSPILVSLVCDIKATARNL